MPFSSLCDGIPTSAIRCRIDHFTLPNLSHAIFISLRYSGRRRTDIDLIQFCHLGKILWQVLLIRIYNGISQLDVTMQNTYIFLFWRLPRISYFHGRVQPIIIFSQILWILSIRLIVREINMHTNCSQWQLSPELCNSREKKTYWTLDYCIIKFGWNIDLQPKIDAQLKRSNCER